MSQKSFSDIPQAHRGLAEKMVGISLHFRESGDVLRVLCTSSVRVEVFQGCNQIFAHFLYSIESTGILLELLPFFLVLEPLPYSTILSAPVPSTFYPARQFDYYISVPSYVTQGRGYHFSFQPSLIFYKLVKLSGKSNNVAAALLTLKSY